MTKTIEQAVGQMILVAFHGTNLPADLADFIQRQELGGVSLFRAMNITDATQTRALTAALQKAAADSGQPLLLVAADQEGGQLNGLGDEMTPFPGNMALGAVDDVELTRKVGHALGLEVAAVGVNVNYAPVCDVNNNPDNPVIGVRAFGGDPALVARHAAAMVDGIQSAGVAAVAKHFPGHGDTGGDSHHGLPVEHHTWERLAKVELPPFEAAIDAKLMMTAHLAYPNLEEDGRIIPATLSGRILDGHLRQEMGYQGIILSDAMNMAAIQQGQGLIVDTLAAAAAGIDLLLLLDDMVVQQEQYDALVQATQRGLLSPSKIKTSAERILALKRWLAGSQQPPLEVIGCAEHQALAYEVARRSVTLVRDEANLLPLKLAADDRVALMVPQPADLIPADTSSYVKMTLAQELRRFHSAVDEVRFPHDLDDAQVADLRQQMPNYNLLIIGTLNALVYPGQAALVDAALASGVPTVVAALRLPYDLRVFPSVPTYACTYSILPPAMKALAEALFGQVAFQGNLPVAIPGLKD